MTRIKLVVPSLSKMTAKCHIKNVSSQTHKALFRRFCYKALQVNFTCSVIIAFVLLHVHRKGKTHLRLGKVFQVFAVRSSCNECVPQPCRMHLPSLVTSCMGVDIVCPLTQPPLHTFLFSLLLISLDGLAPNKTKSPIPIWFPQIISNMHN